jgi:hypothetical protein
MALIESILCIELNGVSGPLWEGPGDGRVPLVVGDLCDLRSPWAGSAATGEVVPCVQAEPLYGRVPKGDANTCTDRR